MSKCAVCMDYFHPDYIVYQEIRGDEVKVCAFCRTGKNELTIVDDDGKLKEKVNKKQASIAYKKYLDDLIRKPNIGKIVQESQSK